MATIKSYTDIPQSKKLAEFLLIESADMYIVFENNAEPRVYYGKIPTAHFVCKPCWSLAALLKTLNFPSLTQNKEDEWEVCVFDHDNDDYIEKTASNPVDTCYEMILYLKDKNLL